MAGNMHEECCPPFDPAAWDGQEIHWEGKPFLKTQVRSVLRIPLNFGAVMRRSMATIEQAGVAAEAPIVLAANCTLWRTDVYIAVARAAPELPTVNLSGDYLAKVFEGPFSRMGRWIKEMQAFAQGRGWTPSRLLFYYTTCPKCAKRTGRNHVVILAQR
jgi:hypothetical protein